MTDAHHIECTGCSSPTRCERDGCWIKQQASRSSKPRFTTDDLRSLMELPDWHRPDEAAIRDFLGWIDNTIETSPSETSEERVKIWCATCGEFGAHAPGCRRGVDDQEIAEGLGIARNSGRLPEEPTPTLCLLCRHPYSQHEPMVLTEGEFDPRSQLVCPVEPSERDAALLDRAYYDGARQAQSIAHQSLVALDKWINEGCGNRMPQARAVLSKCPQCQQTGGFHLAICDQFDPSPEKAGGEQL